MRAIAAFLLLLAGGAEGRLPLFGQTDEDGTQAERMGLSGQLPLGEQPGQLEVARCTERAGHDDDLRPRHD